jgi:hypothetical protein
MKKVLLAVLCAAFLAIACSSAIVSTVASNSRLQNVDHLDFSDSFNNNFEIAVFCDTKTGHTIYMSTSRTASLAIDTTTDCRR